MAVTDAPWDGSASRWPTPIAYCSSCLIDTNTGTKTKSNCSLPIREPGGAINSNGVHAAAAALAGARGTKLPADQKKAAAKTLVGIYRNDLKETPPDSLVALAGL